MREEGTMATCPFCGAPDRDGTGECGGDGEGICVARCVADDLVALAKALVWLASAPTCAALVLARVARCARTLTIDTAELLEIAGAHARP